MGRDFIHLWDHFYRMPGLDDDHLRKMFNNCHYNA